MSSVFRWFYLYIDCIKLVDFDLQGGRHGRLSYSHDELLGLGHHASLPRSMRKAIFRHGLWLPRMTHRDETLAECKQSYTPDQLIDRAAVFRRHDTRVKQRRRRPTPRLRPVGNGAFVVTGNRPSTKQHRQHTRSSRPAASTAADSPVLRPRCLRPVRTVRHFQVSDRRLNFSTLNV